MIKKYTVTKIVLANSVKEVLDIEKGDIVEVSLNSEIDTGDGLGFTKEYGERKRN